MLSISKFANLIETAPLISIDLIVQNKNKILLGKRNNEPAKGYWFVPGGRILKNETINQAIKRISLKEINVEVSIDYSDFLGVFEHFYTNSFVSNNISTHYVVLAYKVTLNIFKSVFPLIEHKEYNFFSLEEIKANHLVHAYTKHYFYSGA